MKKVKFLILFPLLIILCSVILYLSYEYEKNKMPWGESHTVVIFDAEISLPCTIDEFKRATSLELIERIDTNDYRGTVRMVDVDLSKRIKGYEYNSLVLQVNGDTITAISLYLPIGIGYEVIDEPTLISNVVFPGGISAKDSMKEVNEKLSTGLFNFFRRKDSHDYAGYPNAKGTDFFLGYGNSYIGISFINDNIQSITYFYDEILLEDAILFQSLHKPI